MLVDIKSPAGVGRGTQIIEPKTGIDLALGAEKVEITIQADDVNRATIYLGLVSVEAHADAQCVVLDPRSGNYRPVARIVFADDGADLDLN